MFVTFLLPRDGSQQELKENNKFLLGPQGTFFLSLGHQAQVSFTKEKTVTLLVEPWEADLA